MPNIIITEADFEKLSDDTKKELWGLLQNSFSSKPSSNEDIDKEIADYIRNINPASFDTLSIETALSVLIGLSEESRKVVEALCKRKLTRDDLTKILGNEKKINGTIGSINRRLAKRLDQNIYGDRRDRVKLIEFDENYSLSCNNRALEIALLIISKGYKIGEGDILLKFRNPSTETLIREDAIILGDTGKARVSLEGWDYTIEHVDYSFSVTVIVCDAGDKIVISTIREDEWEPNSLSEYVGDVGEPHEILIGGKKR